MLSPVRGVSLRVVASSAEAANILATQTIDCVVTDILRRNPDRSVSEDDGYGFVKRVIRPKWSDLRVIFHTKNLPSTFVLDRSSEYLSKWESEEYKGIELARRIHAAVNLYDAFADFGVWARVEPRLVRVQAELLSKFRDWGDVWALTASQFEQLVAELLQKIGYDVLWIPGGQDEGIDIIASSRDTTASYLIDVKRYAKHRAVGVELVRAVYGVVDKVRDERPDRDWHGGIITTSRFTAGAEAFRDSSRVRPLLQSGEWLRASLGKHIPLIR
jgi:CheY-like chemotaxis protein